MRQNQWALQRADGTQIEGQSCRRSDRDGGMYQGSRAGRGGVVCHFASGIEQTGSNATGNENPMDGEEPQYRPPERMVTAPLVGPWKQGRRKHRAVF